MVAERAGLTPSGNQVESRVTEREQRRARVLKYPDLAKKLTEAPLGFRTPAARNGYIPPNAMPQEACPQCRSDPGMRGCRNVFHTAPINDSPQRTALVALAAEALRREQAEQAAHE
jgi:hypothetical protein